MLVVLSFLCSINCGDRQAVEPLRDARPTDLDVLRAPPTDLSPPLTPDLSSPLTPDLSPPIDAEPLPPGCKLHHEGLSSSCKSAAKWTSYATSTCQQMGLPVVLNITFLEPCGYGLYRYVSAVCCPASDGP
jgi:hypothetical protein